MTSFSKLPRRVQASTRALLANRRGNVLMLTAFAAIPLTLSTGMAIDYSQASRLQTKLNAAADAAALAAVTQPMMKQDNTAAKNAAINMFNSQVAGLKGLTYNQADLIVSVAGTVGAANWRKVEVTYKAKSVNTFAKLVGMNTIDIGGVAKAGASAAPNIDFYVLLDTSPSMLLPATSDGLSLMVKKTGGCAFACHQTDHSSSVSGELVKIGNTYYDYYEISQQNKITLRSDVLHSAIGDLTDTATKMSGDNGATYRMGLFSFDYKFKNIWPTSPSGGYYLESTLATLKNHVTDASVLVYCRNNQRVCGTSDNDTATNFTTAFSSSNSAIPAPGDGTNTAGDKPQAILFLLTDGMRDENSGGRQMGPIPTSQCDTIKSRGIRIAVLYTEYLPDSASDDWSKTNVRDPYLTPTDKISPALISCASSGLFYKVTTDSDVSAALTALFQKAVSTAHLTQ
jgi:Flp pilus assembly protein TadG